VSWLLVAFVPGLLMLATFGLDRLEAGLDDSTVSNDDVDEFLEQAKAESVRKPRNSLVRRDTGLQDTLPLRETRWNTYAAVDSEPCLPTRVYVHHRPNPQFQPTRHADRV
jgi:hypothetical protein